MRRKNVKNIPRIEQREVTKSDCCGGIGKSISDTSYNELLSKRVHEIPPAVSTMG
jgi:Fe-S oxidoreductase